MKLKLIGPDWKGSVWKSLFLIPNRGLLCLKRWGVLWLRERSPWRGGRCLFPCRPPRRHPGVSPPTLSPLLLFSFSSSEPCHPGSSAEAVKEDGKPSYRRMITIINIHGWFTYHSWLHRHGSRYETSTGVARWYILHCATMDLCIL